MAGEVKSFRVLRTLFLVGEEDNLKHILEVQIDNSGSVAAGYVTADLGGQALRFDLPQINRGLNHYQVTVPEVREPTRAAFTLSVGGGEQRYQTMLEPVRRWRIFITPFSHHDLGYTDIPQVCIQQHRDFFNSIVDYCRQTDGFPEEARFRWTCDTTWAVKYYLQDATERQAADFFDLVRDGRVEITAQYAAFNTALLTHEELVRSIYYAHELGKKHGFAVTSAMTTDIPGAPWGFPQVLAKSGVHYLSTAVNQNWAQDGVPRAKVPRISRPFYWAAPDGSEVLVWNTDPVHIYGEGRKLGFTESVDTVHAELPAYLRDLEAGGYEYDTVAFRTTTKVSDNAPPFVALSRIVRQWNDRYAYPRLCIATSTQFFRHMEERYAGRFPHYSGDWTDWWIDGPGSSAYETAITRVAHEELASADKLRAIVAALEPGRAYPAARIESAYDNLMLYDEHTWGMWNNVSDPFLATTAQEWAFKVDYAKNAVALTRDLLADGLQVLGSHIATGDTPAIVVFNGLSWPRSGLVHARLERDALNLGRPLRLLDTGGRDLAYQIVERHDGGSLTIAFYAEDVPSVGYSTYRIARGEPAGAAVASGQVNGYTIENRFYRVTLDPRTGGVASVWDKELGIELVDRDSVGAGLPRPYVLNQLIYDSGEPPINGRFSPESADIVVGTQGPLWTSAVAVTRCRMGKDVRLSEPHWGKGRLAPDVLPWIRQEVILYEHAKRIDFVNRLYKEETLEKEGLYYAFPFAVKDGQVKLEVAGASMRPGLDQLPDSCHDWHAMDYWLDISGPECGVTWSSREVPVVSINDINTGKWQTSLPLDNGTFFAYAANNYWTTNFKERQGGDLTFRFSFTSHGADWDEADSARFGWSYCTDLLTAVLPPGQAGSLAESGSFLQVDRRNAMCFTLKRAEDGDGLIARLIELTGEGGAVRVSLPSLSLSEAFRTDIVERDLERLPVSEGQALLTLPPFGIETVRLRTA